MAGEPINKFGASGWQTVASSVSVAAGAYQQMSSTNTIASLMAVSEEDYPLVDVQITVAGTAPTQGNTLGVYQRVKADGTNEAPAPSSGWKFTLVGWITLDSATGTYYGVKLPVADKNATFYIYSNEASNALTLSMTIRMRTLAPAP